MRSIFLMALWVYAGACFAQTPSYIHYDRQDGLPGNLVYCATQDHQGMMWFGTDKGLASFDGTRFRTYGLEDGLPDLEVLKMKEDSQGRLWLFCFRKELCYLFNGRIYNKTQDSLLAKIALSSNLSHISEDAEGGLWFFDYSPTFFHLKGQTVTSYSMIGLGASLQEIDGEKLIIGNNCLYRFNESGGVEVVSSFRDKVGRTSVAISGNRLLYSYDENRLLLVEFNGGQVSIVEDRLHPFSQVYTDSQGRFWLSSSIKGAVCFDNDRQDLSNPVHFLSNKKNTTVFEDKDGTIWFGTTDEGIYAMPRNAPVHFNDFPSNNIRSVSGDRAGNIFAGDDKGNVHVINEKGIRSISLSSMEENNYVRQIIPEGSGVFWTVSDRNISRYQHRTSQLDRFSNGQSFKSIFLHKDAIWFAASSALGYFSSSGRQGVTVIEKRFTSLGGDSEGNLWAGDLEGFYSQRDSFQFNWGEMFPELKSRITAIQNAGDNRLWVATPENGLMQVDVHEGKVTGVQTINEQLEEPIQNIQSLFTDDNHRVWMATNHGVFGLDTDGGFWHYDRHDGLADDDVNGVYVCNDTLWAATVSGLTRLILRPPDNEGNFATLVSRLRFRMGNRTVTLHLQDSLPENRRIILQPGASSIDLDLAGLDFANRGKLAFEVERTEELLPFSDWTLDNLLSWLGAVLAQKKETEYLTSPTYNLGTFVPPGRYRIQITAITGSGGRSRFPVSWTLVKRSYWYQTIWFYLTLWAIAAYGIWRIYKARLAYREINAAVSSLQLQALQAQMNPHFIGNSINAIQQFMHPPDPVKASEYISIFTRLLRRTMLYSENTFISFEEESAYDQEYLQMIGLRFGDRIKVEITGADTIPSDMPFPSMLLQPVLENATIHGLSPEGVSHIHLHFAIQDEQLQCTLTDNGIGIVENRRIKQLMGRSRDSKGLDVLKKKINTLNRLYDLDISLAVTDLTETTPPRRGTQVSITCHMPKLWKVLKNHPLQQIPVG